MDIQTFFDPATSTFSHLVWDPDTLDAAIVDPVLDYDPKSGRTTTDNADKVIDAMSAKQLKLRYILETHAHADHLTAAPYLKSRCGGQIAIGAKICQVQEVFRGIFNLRDLATDGSQFDVLLTEGDTLSLGSLSIEVLDTPGHTPACISYRIDDAIFIGDTFFSPGYGTARADFPGGNAEALYNSLQRLLSYPDGTRLYLCHDYTESNTPPAAVYTVREQREGNIQLRGKNKEAYVKLRGERDAQLEMPVLILPSIQVNIRAGVLPPPEDNGVSYLKIPLNQL